MTDRIPREVFARHRSLGERKALYVEWAERRPVHYHTPSWAACRTPTPAATLFTTTRRRSAMPDKPDEPIWRRKAREANERRQREQSRVMDMSLTTEVRDDNRKQEKEPRA